MGRQPSHGTVRFIVGALVSETGCREGTAAWWDKNGVLAPCHP